ncbi:hypothetical protein HDU76_009330 [Blyttiomyces sp. JEL0837]|nr:hypothetical protein HDU76_009330 [Blyttiomyces sp. JEL0837]
MEVYMDPRPIINLAYALFASRDIAPQDLLEYTEIPEYVFTDPTVRIKGPILETKCSTSDCILRLWVLRNQSAEKYIVASMRVVDHDPKDRMCPIARLHCMCRGWKIRRDWMNWGVNTWGSNS